MTAVDAPSSDAEHADVETASDDYAARFTGPTGAWMLARQERIVRSFLRGSPGATVLDVGGGHAQLALPLCRAGCHVTVLGSDAACGRRVAAEVATGRIRFDVGDLVRLPYADRSFLAAVSIRLLPHCARWPDLIAELCRVANRMVIVDYPTRRSVNVLADALFGLKKRIEGNTRPYTLFDDREIGDAFAAQGFDLRARRPQFFFPMVLHRALRQPWLSASLEATAGAFGLTALFGSPVLAAYVRRPAAARIADRG